MSGVEAVINVLEASLRESPDSGIGDGEVEPGTSEMSPPPPSLPPPETTTVSSMSVSEQSKQSFEIMGDSEKILNSKESDQKEKKEGLSKEDTVDIENNFGRNTEIEKKEGEYKKDLKVDNNNKIEGSKMSENINNDHEMETEMGCVQENKEANEQAKEIDHDNLVKTEMDNVEEDKEREDLKMDLTNLNVGSNDVDDRTEMIKVPTLNVDIDEEAREIESTVQSVEEESKECKEEKIMTDNETPKEEDQLTQDTTINSEIIEEQRKTVKMDVDSDLIMDNRDTEIRKTPHPMSRIEVLKKQESEDVTHFSLQPNCSSPHDDIEPEDEDERELRKLSWDSDSDERIDLGLEDGTPLKVQVIF